MLIAQILIIATVAIGLVVAYILCKKRFTIPSRAFKILTAVLAVVFFVRFMWNRDLLMDIIALEGSQLDSTAMTVVVLVANWLLTSLLVLMLLHPFYNSSRTRIILRYYGSAVLLLYLATLRSCTISLYGSDVYSSFDLRITLMAVELGMMIAIVAIEWIGHLTSRAQCNQCDNNTTVSVACDNSVVQDNNSTASVEDTAVDASQCVRKPNTNKVLEVLAILGLIAGMIVANWPSYFLQAVVVDPPTDIVYKAFSIEHIILYVSAYLLLFAMYLALRYRKKSTIKHILTYISISTIVSFCNTVRFVDYIDVADWPIHICNVAMFLVPLCLLTNNRKIFSFISLVSVPAAIIAMLFPNYDLSCNYASWQLVRFWTNHYTPLIMPFLMVMLGVYSKPTLKDVKYAIISLAIFVVLMIFANAYCLDATPDIDFFFLNGTQISSVIGIGATRNILWEFYIGKFHFMIYPVYFLVFYATMAALCFVICYLYRLLIWFDSKARIRYMSRQLKSSAKYNT